MKTIVKKILGASFLALSWSVVEGMEPKEKDVSLENQVSPIVYTEEIDFERVCVYRAVQYAYETIKAQEKAMEWPKVVALPYSKGVEEAIKFFEIPITGDVQNSVIEILKKTSGVENGSIFGLNDRIYTGEAIFFRKLTVFGIVYNRTKTWNWTQKMKQMLDSAFKCFWVQLDIYGNRFGEFNPNHIDDLLKKEEINVMGKDSSSKESK